MVRLSKCSVDKNELNAVKNVLNSEFFGTGPVTKEFEDNLRDFFGNPDYDLVCTNTGTSALQLALQACKFKKKSEGINLLNFFNSFSRILNIAFETSPSLINILN